MKKLFLLIGLVVFLAPSLAYSEWGVVGSYNNENNNEKSCPNVKSNKRLFVHERRKLYRTTVFTTIKYV